MRIFTRKRYIKNPEEFESLLIFCRDRIPAQYVVFKPLAEWLTRDKPQTVIFFVNPISFRATVWPIMTRDNENVIMPYARAVRPSVFYPYRERSP